MKLKLIILLMVFSLLSVSVFAEQVRVIDTITIEEISPTLEYQQWWPSIYGDKVAWVEVRTEGSQPAQEYGIVLFDLNSKEKTVVAQSLDESISLSHPQLTNDSLFYLRSGYLRSPGGQYPITEIIRYDLASRATSVVRSADDYEIFPCDYRGDYLFFRRKIAPAAPEDDCLMNLLNQEIDCSWGGYCGLIDYPWIIGAKGAYNLLTEEKITHDWQPLSFEDDQYLYYLTGPNWGDIHKYDITNDVDSVVYSSGARFNAASGGIFISTDREILDLNQNKIFEINMPGTSDFRIQGDKIVFVSATENAGSLKYPVSYTINLATLHFKFIEREVQEELQPTTETVEPLPEIIEYDAEGAVPESSVSGCTKDSQCESNHCNTETGRCVECLTAEHCPTSIAKTQETKCSLDSLKVISETRTEAGKCQNFKCVYEAVIETETIKNCRDFDTYCLNAECGCSEGYKACDAAGRCVRTKVKKAGDYYSCEFECESGFGREGMCFNPITSRLSSANLNLEPGEETGITISLDNAMDYEMRADILLTIGSKASIKGAISHQCSQNICRLFREVPSKGLASVSIELECNEQGIIPIGSKVTYSVDGKSSTIEETLQIECEVPETRSGLGIVPLLGILVVIVLIGSLIVIRKKK